MHRSTFLTFSFLTFIVGEFWFRTDHAKHRNTGRKLFKKNGNKNVRTNVHTKSWGKSKANAHIFLCSSRIPDPSFPRRYLKGFQSGSGWGRSGMTLAVGRADAGLMMLAAGCLTSIGDHMSLWDAAKQASINLFFHFERLLQLQDCDAVVWP